MTANRTLRVPAVPASLTAVHELLAELWTSGRVESSDRMRFECAVIEIAANILEYSRPAADDTTVTLAVELQSRPDAVRAVFEDDGQPPDVQLVGLRMPETSAENGRGLALADATSDVLHYQRAGALNRWTVECLRTDTDGRTPPTDHPTEAERPC